MGSYEIQYCDSCDKEIELDKNYRRKSFLIYKISFWNNKTYEEQEIDFMSPLQLGETLMLCSKECIGEYISNLLNNVKKGD